MKLLITELEIALEKIFFAKSPTIEMCKKIFEDTKKLCRENSQLVESIKDSIINQYYVMEV